MNKLKNLILNLLVIVTSSLIIFAACESFLRLKHRMIPNYDIEMWKYSKLLKKKSKNDKIGHTHIPNKSATLQKIKIEINNIGQRGNLLDLSSLETYDRKIMFLGSSMLLGWGVENDKIFPSIVQKRAIKNNQKWLVLNGGVGNYNTARYVENYLVNWSHIQIDDLIVAYFVNDSEILNTGKPSFLEKHTHIGVLIWKYVNSKKNIFKTSNTKNYYEKIYENDYEGLIVAKNELKRLWSHCLKNDIKCKIILIPHVVKIDPYELNFINDSITSFANQNKMETYDLLSDLQNLKNSQLTNNYQDQHLNAIGHNVLGHKIYEILNK